MGEVYEAEHVSLPRRFAIKLLRGDIAENQDALRRFHREASIAASLGSPHIVEVFDFSQTEDGAAFMAMEFLVGSTLRDRLDERGALSQEEILTVLSEVCDGLVAAHAAGIVHRDLKPENIFLARTRAGGETVKILDFGISKMRSSGTFQTQDGAVLGTPSYMSPEQASGDVNAVDSRSDIFSLAVIVYEMLTGTVAFGGPSIPAIFLKLCYADPVPLEQGAPWIPRSAAEAVRRAMSKDPAQRFPDVQSFLEALRLGFLASPNASPQAGAPRASASQAGVSQDGASRASAPQAGVPQATFPPRAAVPGTAPPQATLPPGAARQGAVGAAWVEAGAHKSAQRSIPGVAPVSHSSVGSPPQDILPSIPDVRPLQFSLPPLAALPDIPELPRTGQSQVHQPIQAQVPGRPGLGAAPSAIATQPPNTTLSHATGATIGVDYWPPRKRRWAMPAAIVGLVVVVGIALAILIGGGRRRDSTQEGNQTPAGGGNAPRLRLLVLDGGSSDAAGATDAAGSTAGRANASPELPSTYRITPLRPTQRTHTSTRPGPGRTTPRAGGASASGLTVPMDMEPSRPTAARATSDQSTPPVMRPHPREVPRRTETRPRPMRPAMEWAE